MSTDLLERETNRGGLTEEQKAQFERDGYIVIRALYSDTEIRDICDAFMEQAKDGPVPGLSDVPAYYPKTEQPDPLQFYPRMLHPHAHPELKVGQIARGFMLDPRIRPIMTDLFGEEGLGVQTMFYFKPAGARGQALHQDNLYLRVSPGTCMAAWLAVDDADEENGGMVVVPKSNTIDLVCPEEADPDSSFSTHLVPVPKGLSEVPVTLKAGDVLFFNGSLIHGSYPNSSKNRFRRSLIAHYAPRYSQELASFYKAPTTFDGEVIELKEAVGGGPCGTNHAPTGPH